MQLLIAQQVYSIWKLADGDDWGWNLNPREVRIDFFFPAVMIPGFCWGYLQRFSWKLSYVLWMHKLAAEGSSSSPCKGKEAVFSLRWSMSTRMHYELPLLYTGGISGALWLLPVPSARVMAEFQCGQIHGCESLSMLSADANVVMPVNKSQSTENSGDLNP